MAAASKGSSSKAVEVFGFGYARHATVRGKHVVVASTTGEFRFDLATGEFVDCVLSTKKIAPYKDGAKCRAWGARDQLGTRIVLGSGPTQRRERLATPGVRAGATWQVGKHLVVVGGEYTNLNRVMVFDAATRRRICTIDHFAAILHHLVLADDVLATVTMTTTGGQDRKEGFAVWSLETQKLVHYVKPGGLRGETLRFGTRTLSLDDRRGDLNAVSPTRSVRAMGDPKTAAVHVKRTRTAAG